MEKAKRSDDLVIRPSDTTRFLYLFLIVTVGIIVIPGVGLAAFWMVGVIPWAMLIVFAAVYMAAFLMWPQDILQYKLVVTPDGLERHGHGVYFYKWQDLHRLKWKTVVDNRYNVRTEKNTLYIEATPSKTIRRMGGLWIGWQTLSYGYCDWTTMIQVESFLHGFEPDTQIPPKTKPERVEQFKRTTLGKVLLAEAPHIFEDVEEDNQSVED